MKLLSDNERIWCLTNKRRYGGAIGLYNLPILKTFCMTHRYLDILIGVGNRDFAYVMESSQKNRYTLEYLLKTTPDIMDNNGT